MEKLKHYLRQNLVAVNIIIMLIGVISIFFSVYLPTPNLQTIVMGIGTSLFSSGLIVFITSLFVDDSSDSMQILKQWGVEAVYKTRGEMNISCEKYTKKAKSIDIIAFGLRSWRDSKNREIESLLRNGCQIRILTMHPESENLTQREIDEKQETGSIAHTITQLKAWADKLNSRNYKGSIEIRYYDSQPLDFMFLMNNRFFWGPYEYGKSSQQTISYEFNTTGDGYKYYSEYFNDLWNDPDFAKTE